MSTFLGFVFLLGAIVASIREMPDTATFSLILSCFNFIVARIDRLEDTLLDD